MDWYNGFSPAERGANGVALSKALNAGTPSKPTGECALCSDPNAALEYHSEDYAKPYRWTVPAAYALCRHCHRNKLHKRFANPGQWEMFKAHIRRGGYASELKDPEIKRELGAYRRAREAGQNVDLRPIRPYRKVAGEEWWERLSLV